MVLNRQNSRWILGHAGSVRMLSFLPVAEVERTADRQSLPAVGRAAFYRGDAVQSARPLMVVVHRFMEPGELQMELGRQRLEACVFKWPVDGEMVSLCEVNATNLRRQLNPRGAGRLVANHRQ